MTPEEFTRFFAHPARLALGGLLALQERTSAELAELLDVPRQTVLEWLGQLAVAGVVRVDGLTYSLDRDGVEAVAATLPFPSPPAPEVFFGMTEAEAQVLARHFVGRRLTAMPSDRRERRIVLERLALDFEPGRHYPEREVNGKLSLWHPDYAMLRRWLVDEGFLDRGGGEYWRSGGRVDV